MTTTLPESTQTSTSSSTDSKPVTAEDLLNAAQAKKREEELVAWVKGQYKQMRNARMRVERNWYLYLAFVRGRQNVQWIQNAASTTGYKLYIPPAPPWRVRLVINRIRPIIRKVVAKLTSQKPNWEVVPATSDDEDLAAARAAEDILDAAYRNKNIQGLLRRAVWWAQVCGTGYIKEYWDSNCVDKVSNQRGDICFEVVMPFNIFVPNLKEPELDKQPYIFHVTTMDINAVKQRYKDSVAGKPLQPTVVSSNEILEDAFMNLTGGSANIEKECLVIEAWFNPGAHPKFPNGGMVTVVSDQVVQVIDGFPYQYGCYPFVKIDGIETGQYYCDSIIGDLVPIQREYNRTRSQIVESKNRMSKPQLLAAKGSIDARKVTSEPGQVIEYTVGFPAPTPLPLQSIPSYVLEEINQLQTDFDDIAGQHDVSRGQAPSQVTAASAINSLQEADDTMLSSEAASVEAAVKKLGELYLGYVSQFWTTPRLVQIVGQDKSFEAATYKGADLRGCKDVFVEEGSALAVSKAAKQALITDWMSRQLIPPDKGFEMLGMAGIEKLYEDMQTDVRQAQRENLKMSKMQAEQPQIPMQGMQGMLPGMEPQQPELPQFPVNSWDNHQVHIERHNQYRKTEAFESLPDEIKQVFESHVEAHQSALAQGQMQMQQMQQPPGPVGNTANASIPSGEQPTMTPPTGPGGL